MTQFAKEFFDALARRSPAPSVTLEVATDDGKTHKMNLNVGDTLDVHNTLTWNGGGADIKVERHSIVKVMSING